MATFVITGSSRGIGFGLADVALSLGHNVVVSGSRPASTDKAVTELAVKHGTQRMLGLACDVTEAAQVQALWDAAVQRFSQVDYWVNNAGVANILAPIWDIEPHEIDEVARIDMAGLMHGTRVAVRGMRGQPSGGFVYNMEGFGSRDEFQPGLGVYGSAKRGVRYFNQAMAREVKGTKVKICAVSPGIVVTDFLTRQSTKISPERWEQSKKIFNILGDTVVNVAPFLVKEMLANTKNGASIRYLTRSKAMLRFASAPFVKRKII